MKYHSPLSSGYEGDDLIFIISQPRSGSTLLQRLLAGHPEVQTAAETWLMLHPVYGGKDSGIQTEFGAAFAYQAVEEFLVNYTSGPEVYDEGVREFARRIYQEALSRSGKRFFLDKTPRYFFVIPELFRLFPRAKFVFLLRNPLAVLYSELATYVKEDWTVLSVFAPDLLLAPRRIIDGIDLLGPAGVVVRYEELVQEPERQMRRLSEHLGIDFVPAMVDYSGTPAPKGFFNDPTGIHKYKQPSRESINKWKLLADNVQMKHFGNRYLRALGREVFESYGYSYDEAVELLLEDGDARNGYPAVFPWDIAIRPQGEWTVRDWFVVDRYWGISKNGKVRGTLAAAKQAVRRTIRLAARETRGSSAVGSPFV